MDTNSQAERKAWVLAYMRLGNHKKCLFFLFFFFLIFGIFQYSIHRIYGMVYYPDEFGYWANAAGWLGYDWSNLTALGSYYSFGYSLVLSPILRICPDGVTAYRMAVAVNMLLQAASAPLLYGIFLEIIPEAGGPFVISAVGISLFYPVWIFYGQATLAEGLLFFLYILIVYLITRIAGQVRARSLLLLALTLVYLCFVHMRTIGIVAAAVFMLLFRLGEKPAHRNRLLLVFGLLAAGGILGIFIRMAVIHSVYGSTTGEMLAHNDITGQLARVFAICSGEESVEFLCGCVGKFFYLGAASFGLVYYALAYLGHNSVRLLLKIRRKKRTLSAEWISFFLLLSFIGQFLVTAVYLYHPRRADEVVYGRYNDYLLPVFMGIGYLVLCRCKNCGKNTAFVILLQSAMLPVVLYGESLYGGNEIQGYFMAGIGYLVDDLHFDVIPDMAGICLLGNLLILAVSVGVWIGRKIKMPVPFMAVAVLCEIALGTGLNDKYTFRFNELIRMELQISDWIAGTGKDEPITYLYEGRIAYIDTIQFNLPGREIKVITEEEFQAGYRLGQDKGLEEWGNGSGEGGYLILDIDSAYRKQMEQGTKPCLESAYFVLYDLQGQ